MVDGSSNNTWYIEYNYREEFLQIIKKGGRV
jgi:hypothetical protein